MIKCIICDLDGTLVTSSDTIEEHTLERLKEAIDSGVEFVIATGRDINMVVDVLDRFDIECTLILNNGTQIRNRSGSFNEMHPMDDDAFIKISTILNDHHYLQAIHTTDGMYSLHSANGFWDYHIKLILNGKRDHWKKEEDLPDKTFFRKDKYLRTFHFAKTPQDVLNAGVKVMKIDARHLGGKEVEEVQKLLNIDHLAYSSSFGENIEITSDTYNKGKMIQEYIHSKGYKDDEIAVFGDGENDVEMLGMFHHSFAPINSCDSAKEKATYNLTKSDITGAVGEGIDLLKEMHLL